MLKQATLTFLKNLKKHNDRPWFNEHKEQYQAAKEDFEHLIAAVLEKYGRVEPEIGLLEPKDCTFRIYRDVRFSKDKTPYKVHFAASIRKGGKKVHFPGFYLHVEPDGLSSIGGGIWRPGRETLKKIRQEIDYSFQDFSNIVESKDFKNTFGTLSEEDTLVRPPKGYEKDNPAIHYIKLKSFTAGKSIEDSLLTSGDLVKEIVETFKKLKPLIDFFEMAMDG